MTTAPEQLIFSLNNETAAETARALNLKSWQFLNSPNHIYERVKGTIICDSTCSSRSDYAEMVDLFQNRGMCLEWV